MLFRSKLKVTPAAAGKPCLLQLVQPQTGLVLVNQTRTLPAGQTSVRWSGLTRFFTHDFPETFRRRGRFFLTAVLLLLAGAFVGYGAAISIKGLRREFRGSAGTVTALDGVDLSIAPGEFVCIVGPSGCGKSTLLRILAGLDRQTSGTIDVDAKGWKVQNAMVFQESGLFPWMSVETNVRFGLDNRGVPADEANRRVEAALKLVGLGKFRKHYPHQLSGGMRQRSAIARAFVTEPAMLLMDEPFAALDEITRFKLNNDLLQLWQQLKWTVIFVTHSVFESVYLSNRILVMSARPGRIVDDVAIDAPYPRDDRFRVSDAYGELCRVVSRRLHEAIAA